MSIFEYIILAVIAALTLFYLIRIIVKIAKGESPCFCCKSSGDDEKSSSCCASGNDKSSGSSCGSETEKD